MGIVAKSAITLVSVNDAYTLSLAPHSCIIKADFDGQHPQLGVAESVISVLCGDERMPISIAPTEVTSSHSEIKYTLSKANDFQYRLRLTSIPVGIAEGQLAFTVRLGNGTVMEGKFSFTVVRESTMLDWIQDWENNKTKLAGSYIITPKLFVGNKISGNYDSINKVPGLTGVYIGPTSDGSAGLFGYKDSREIFRLDKNGGKIGGWEIVSGGIRNSEGSLLLDASGSISSQTSGKIHWFLRKDGSASFANGNVTMDASGNAAFTGRLTSKSGEIGGWSIGEDSLSNIGTALHATKHFIAIANVTAKQASGNQLDWVRTFGGVALHYTSDKDYGLIAYNGNTRILSVGAINQIAGWNLDNSAIWIGAKNNNAGQYTEAPGSITLGTNGLRGNSWYINKDGSVSFAHGAVQFNDRIGKIAGWNFDTDAIYTGTKKNVAFTFTDAPGHITIGSNGIRGYKWRLNSDGSGVLAGGNIRWNYDGSVEFTSQISDKWETTINETSRKIREDFKEETKNINQNISTTNQNLANLTIGGRNTLANTQLTQLSDRIVHRGAYRFELDSTAQYNGYNSLKIIATKAGSIYNDDCYWLGHVQVSGAYVSVSFFAKAEVKGTLLSVRPCDNGDISQKVTLGTEWQRVALTFQNVNPTTAFGIWFDRAGTVWIALPKMEIGNKATDWSPAPEDVAADAVAKANKALQDAKTYANGIQQDLAKSLDAARTELKKHAADLDAALLSNAQTYADGKVTESEKRMVEDNRQKLQDEQEAAAKRLNEAIAGALTTAKGYVKDVQVGGRNYFGQHKEVATAPAGALSPDNNGVVFRARERLNCRIRNLNLPGTGWYAVSMFIRATKACTIASINLCDAVSKDRTLENVSVTTSFRYITGVFHAERYINDNVWNGFLDFESSIDPSIEVTVRDLMITPGNQPMSWVPAPEDLYADIAAKAKAAQDAAKAYTEAQDRYYQGLQNSYADGQITESEKRMIKDAEEKLQEAKREAQTKADEALIAAKQHTDTIKDTLNSSISAAQTAAKNVQKNLDNLTIGGRNLLRYSALEKTPLNNIVYGRKPENAPAGVEEGYQGAKAVKLVFTTPGKPSVSEVMWHTWEERTDHNRVEPVVLRFWAKADKDNTRMWTSLGYHGGKFAHPTISSEWKEYTVNFMPDGPWALWCIGLDAPGTVWIARPKLEYGTKPTDWTPAPEDVDNSIAGVRNTANQASNDAGDAKQKAGEAATKAGEAATSAGKAEASAKNAETKAGEAAGSAKNAAGSAQTAATDATNAANSANAAKADAAKAKADADAAAQSAKDSKEAANAAKTRLDNWAADNVISPMEKQGLRDETARIDADKSQVAAGYAKYGLGSYQSFTDACNAYRAVLVTLSAAKPETIDIPADFATKQRNYYTQRSTALTRIADAAKEYVDGLQIGGRNLARGTSDEWETLLDGHTQYRATYFKQVQTSSLKNGEYISVSVEFSWTNFTLGDNGRVVVQASGDVTGWNAGAIFDTGATPTIKQSANGSLRYTATYSWEKYRSQNSNFTFSIRFDEATGLFRIRRLMVVRGQKPMDWQPAPEDWVTKINDAKKAGTDANQALTNYKNTVNTTFRNGIIEEAEARAIEKYRNIVNSEFGALTNTYNAINGNAYLEGTAKSALANAFNALRAAKDALITAVNNAASDKRVTEGEKQAVDAKYNAYQSAYAAYSAALETANGSIHAKLKSLADKAANDIQVGGRNLIPDSDNGLLKRFIIHQPNNAPRYSMVDGWWRMAFDRDKQIVSRELTMSSVGTVQGLRKGNLAFSILCRTDGRIVPDNLKISFFGGGQHRYVPANIESCGNNTYRIWGVYMNYPVSDLRVPDFMFFSTADATYVEFRYPKLEYGTKPTDWTPAPEDITSEIAAKTEAARQAVQAEAVGLNKWIAQVFYTGKNNSATPPKLEDIAGKTPTRTVELKDAQFNTNGSLFGMDLYTGIRTTYVYLDADYNLTTGIQHDDAGSLYVNGTLIASGGIQAASWKSVTLPLKRGWNRIDGLWNEGTGGDYFKFQAPLENDAHIIQLACRPNVNIDPMRAVTMTTLTKKYSEIAKTNESIEQRVGKTEESIQEVDKKVTGFTTVDKNGQVLIKPDSVWAGVETKVQQLSDENLKKLSVGGRNLILSSDTSAAPVAMKAPTDGTAYKIFPVKTTLVKHDCQEEEPYTLTVWYTSTSQFPFESFPIGGKPGGDDWSVRFIASEGQITQEGGMKKCVMQAVVPKGGRVLYNPTVGFIYGANSPCNMNLYRVKLERGQKATDWTPAPEDLPTIDTLSRTGIDIQQGVITLDAQKVKVQNGKQVMAMFEGGRLRADLIDASRIDASKLNAGQIFSGTIDARNATFNNLTVSQGSKLGGWKVQGSDLVSDAATNASIRIEHKGKFLTSDESNPIEINNSTGNTLLIDGSRSSVQAEVTLTSKINNIRALSELSPAGLYTNLAAQEYKYGSLGAVVANVMYMPPSSSFRAAGVVGRIHDSAPNRNASYKKGFNGVFGENLRADGLMLGARDLTGDGTVYSIESLMTDTVLLIRGRPIIDLSNTPAVLKGKFFFIFTHTGTRVRFKKDGRITQDNNAWNIFLLFNGSTWEVRSWDCDYREF